MLPRPQEKLTNQEKNSTKDKYLSIDAVVTTVESLIHNKLSTCAMCWNNNSKQFRGEEAKWVNNKESIATLR